jgi:hypothetical protein
MRAWRMAKVDYMPATASAIVARIVGWAAQGDPVSKGPGLTQGDAVQFVSWMALMRHAAAAGVEGYQVAEFTEKGTLRRIRYLREGDPGGRIRQPDGSYLYQYPIIGQERITKPDYGSGQMGANWPRDVALACETVIRSIKDAEQGPEVVPGWGAEFPGGARAQPGMAAGTVAIIVAGVAVAVIGTTAAWRYLSPEVRIEAASVAAAAAAYETRLRAMVTNGVELPPSPIELLQAEKVRAAAKKSQNRGLLVGAAACGGFGLGTVALAFLRSRTAQ